MEGVRRGQAAAGGTALIVMAVLAPLVGGSVWAAVATPEDPRVVVGPALVVTDRPADDAVPGAVVLSTADPALDTPSAPGPEPSTAPTSTSTHDDDSPKTVAPDRVRPVDDRGAAEEEARQDAGVEDDSGAVRPTGGPTTARAPSDTTEPRSTEDADHSQPDPDDD
jgi:hypothetical protein